MSANQIVIEGINLGGLADSKYQGAKNSVAAMRNLDVHTENGVIQLSRGLTNKATGAVAHSGDFTAIVSDSEGVTWFFDDDGKVVKRSGAGVYSTVDDISPDDGDAGVSDACQFGNYIYYVTEKRIGRFDVQALGAGYATKDDDWGILADSALNRSLVEVNEILYISGGRFLSQVESGTLTNTILSFPVGWDISAIGKYGTDLLIGMNLEGNVDQARIVRWNTWSADNSFTNDDLIEESHVSGFLQLGNNILVSAGIRGNLYYYNGAVLEPFKKIPNTGDFDSQAEMWKNASVEFMGQLYFGMSKVSGNDIPQGVYSYGSHSSGYPLVLTMPHKISTGNDENVFVTAMARQGATLFVAWRDENDGTVRGIDEMTTTRHTEGYFETRVINVARNATKDFLLEVFYREISTGGDIEIWVSKDSGDFEQMETRNDDQRNTVITTAKTGECSTIQVRVVLKSINQFSPIVESLRLSFS